MSKKKKIGLVLGGGGARGVAHIGVIKALEQAGIVPDLIVGVSMGALIGACYAVGVPLEELEKEVLSMTKKRAIATLLDLAKPNKSLLKGGKVFKYINRLLKDKDFSDAKIPLRIVVTDLGSGQEIRMKKGHLATAVFASISVPGIFPPIKIRNRYYIDGGVINPTPTDVAKDNNMDFIIGVDLMMKRDIELKNPGIVTTLLQSYEIIRTQGVKMKTEKANGRTIMIKPEIGGTADSFRFKDMPKFIEAGEMATRKAIPGIKQRLAA